MRSVMLVMLLACSDTGSDELEQRIQRLELKSGLRVSDECMNNPLGKNCSQGSGDLEALAKLESRIAMLECINTHFPGQAWPKACNDFNNTVLSKAASAHDRIQRMDVQLAQHEDRLARLEGFALPSNMKGWFCNKHVCGRTVRECEKTTQRLVSGRPAGDCVSTKTAWCRDKYEGVDCQPTPCEGCVEAQ